jgi:hypothetical protein
VIDEAEIERAVHWLVEAAGKAAKARAEREYLSEYRKVLKAEIMREHDDLPLSAQEREAYSDERYKTHLEGLREAIERDEKLRWLKDSAEIKVSAWQSQCRMQKP